MKRIGLVILACLLIAGTAHAFTAMIPAHGTARPSIIVDETGAPLFGANPAKVEVTNFPPSIPPPTYFEYYAHTTVDPCTIETVIKPQGWRLVQATSVYQCCNAFSADCASHSCGNICFDGVFERPVTP